jgi:hypothetical protein
MNFNFFGWIRDGVKEAVLLGVSDAVEEIGYPVDAQDESSKQLLDILRRKRVEDGRGDGKRKRLGRSIEPVPAELGK